MEEFNGTTLVTTTVYLGVVEIKTAGGTQTTSTYYGTFAMRETVSGVHTLYFLHADHLGSNSLVTNSSGAAYSKQLYHPYGTVRYAYSVAMPTAHTYTGQVADVGTGLMYYRARYYSSYLSLRMVIKFQNPKKGLVLLAPKLHNNGPRSLVPTAV